MVCVFFLVILIKEFIAHNIYAKLYGILIFYYNTFLSLDGLTLWILSYWMLKVTYLKFLVIWRFYRFFALLDGIETPENLNRCMSNNFTISGFWRSWHRSWYIWLLRYVYHPLGGSKNSIIRRIFNVWLVFTFVIFSHVPKLVNDIKILLWGWSMAIFMVPEILCNFIFSRKYFVEKWSQSWIWIFLEAVGGSVTIGVLIVANLCGYGIVLSKINEKSYEQIIKELVWKMVADEQVVVYMLVFFFVFNKNNAIC